MHLVAFSVEGYRRFVDKTAVKLHDDLIAFVGPNEAGKSSLLQALAHLNSADPFEQNERPRRTTITPKLAWHFQLKDDDREALAAVPDASHIERLVIAKSADGSKTWDFKPRSPLRDRTNRKSAAELLKAHRDSEPLGVADEDESSEFRLEDYDKAVETLEADVENYLAEHLEGLRGLAVRIRQVDHQFSTDEADEATTPQDDEPTMAWLADRDALADALDLVADQESATSPWHLAVAALKPRVPEILTFEDEDRDLASQYDLTELGGEPPAALGHLAGLANLDLKMLRSEAMAGAVADVTTRRNAANANLTAAFEQSWNQQGIAVQIEVQGTILHVQATTPEDSGVSDIAERSDGMRWFAALLAFAHGWERQPILLVDEIERHLHYDAQADLIEVLSKQEFTSKVIFTTHSFGCLPHDLGTGVRVVQPLNSATSRLENGFWKSGSGFSPLLAAMGAAAMSFTPARHAVVAEGASDAILLPSLLRQASNSRRLGFQVAPGLSSVAAASIGSLDTEAGSVAFLVDGDDGGMAIASKLIDAGVPQARILILKDAGGLPLEVEDLVDGSEYASAVNSELHCWQNVAADVTADDLGTSMRTKAVKAWCEKAGLNPPDKVAVAQRLVDAGSERTICADERRSVLRELLDKIHAVLGLQRQDVEVGGSS